MRKLAPFCGLMMALSLPSLGHGDDGTARRHLDFLESQFDSGFFLLVNKNAQKFLNLSESQVESINNILKKDIISYMPLNEELNRWVTSPSYQSMEAEKRQKKQEEMSTKIMKTAYEIRNEQVKKVLKKEQIESLNKLIFQYKGPSYVIANDAIRNEFHFTEEQRRQILLKSTDLRKQFEILLPEFVNGQAGPLKAGETRADREKEIAIKYQSLAAIEKKIDEIILAEFTETQKAKWKEACDKPLSIDWDIKYTIYKDISLYLLMEDFQNGPSPMGADQVGDGPVPAKNEIVMSPGMAITAETLLGKITITSGKGLKRSYTWEGATRSVEMSPRTERWYGSLGLYFPGPGEHWEEHKGITRGVVEEGQQHFKTVDEAQKWLVDHAYPSRAYRDDGLVVGWYKVPRRRQLTVEVWQILINGKKPEKLKGSQNDKIKVEEPKTPAAKPIPADEVRDGPIPAENEIVMSPGASITAETSSGKIKITAGNGLKRSYTWDGETTAVEMSPRPKRWYGSLGIGWTGPEWKGQKRILQGGTQEGQQHFKTVDEAQKWLSELDYLSPVYRDDGLVVGWRKIPRKIDGPRHLDVQVWQITINGMKPEKLKGSQSDKIHVEDPKIPAAKPISSEEVEDGPIPAENEVALSPGMTISAETSEGKISITAGKGLKRSFTWDGQTSSVAMEPRRKRWYGSMGIGCSGSSFPLFPDKVRNMMPGLAQEGQQHFKTVDEAQEWLTKRSYLSPVYRDDGLVVGWRNVPDRKHVTIEVWQIYINGKKPEKLKGSQNDKIKVVEPKSTAAKLISADEVRDGPVPAKNEIVMSPGTTLTAETRAGKVTIGAGRGLKRSFFCENETWTVEMEPRLERCNGSMGIAEFGPAWQQFRGFLHNHTEEGQQHFMTVNEAQNWLAKAHHGYLSVVYRDDGLVVSWGRTEPKMPIDVEVWQIYINGKKPEKLKDSQNEKINVEEPKTPAAKR